MNSINNATKLNTSHGQNASTKLDALEKKLQSPSTNPEEIQGQNLTLKERNTCSIINVGNQKFIPITLNDSEDIIFSQHEQDIIKNFNLDYIVTFLQKHNHIKNLVDVNCGDASKSLVLQKFLKSKGLDITVVPVDTNKTSDSIIPMNVCHTQDIKNTDQNSTAFIAISYFINDQLLNDSESNPLTEIIHNNPGCFVLTAEKYDSYSSSNSFIPDDFIYSKNLFLSEDTSSFTKIELEQFKQLEKYLETLNDNLHLFKNLFRRLNKIPEERKYLEDFNKKIESRTDTIFHMYCHGYLKETQNINYIEMILNIKKKSALLQSANKYTPVWWHAYQNPEDITRKKFSVFKTQNILYPSPFINNDMKYTDYRSNYVNANRQLIQNSATIGNQKFIPVTLNNPETITFSDDEQKIIKRYNLDYIITFLETHSAIENIVDIGCGDGSISIILQKLLIKNNLDVEVFPVDINIDSSVTNAINLCPAQSIKNTSGRETAFIAIHPYTDNTLYSDIENYYLTKLIYNNPGCFVLATEDHSLSHPNDFIPTELIYTKKLNFPKDSNFLSSTELEQLKILEKAFEDYPAVLSLYKDSIKNDKTNYKFELKNLFHTFIKPELESEGINYIDLMSKINSYINFDKPLSWWHLYRDDKL